MNRPPTILMISTHGYVAGEPPLGMLDTGGQVVFVLELSKALAKQGYRVEVLTRRFEDQSALESVCEDVNVRRFPCGGTSFIPKETLAEVLPEWVDHVEAWLREDGREVAFINSHYWDAGVAGEALAKRLSLFHVHTPHSLGSWKKQNMPGSEETLGTTLSFSNEDPDRATDLSRLRRRCGNDFSTSRTTPDGL